MLSYQHSYHAGSLADVHKHAMLAFLLDYLGRKDKPLSYLETHAGRGLYRLDAPEAAKTGEAAAGIGRAESLFPADHPYRRVLDRTRTRFGDSAYPGSPLVAALMLRPSDRLRLAELHPQEFAALDTALRPFGAEIRREDGPAFALGATPPVPRRGLILLDPSYEVKADYAAMPALLTRLHAKWNVGVLMLWYPLLAGGAQAAMAAALDALALPKAVRHEVRFAPAREGHGMVGSGLYLANAPFGTADEMRRIDGVFAAFRR